MAFRFLLTAFSFILIVSTASAQIREVPKEVEAAFTKQYPKADSATYRDQLLNVRVHFTQDGDTLIATYTNKGLWKETEKGLTFEQLPETVKDGYQKSKYAEWKVAETKLLYRPNNVELYRVKVGKSELQKKNLYFNAKGRLMDDGITL